MANNRWPWLSLFLLLGSHPAAAQDAPPDRRPLQLDDYYRIESAAQPAISPDGLWVAFTRRWVHEEENTRRSDIWLAPADASAAPRRLTHDAFNSDSPVFSPDGKLLAFRSSRPTSTGQRASIWFLRMDAPGEAFQIPGIEGLPFYSPDGRWIAFSKVTPPVDEPKAQALSDLEKKLSERFQGRIFDWMQYRFDRRGYLPDPRDPRASPPRELYIVAAQGGEPKQLTSFGFDVTGFDWGPDSKKLVATADADQRDEWVYERADLWLVDLAGEVERLTDDGFHRSSPVFSPDGRSIAFRQVKGLSLVIAARERGAPQDLAVFDMATRQTRNLTQRWNLRPGSPTWSPDGASVVFGAGIGGNRHLFQVASGGRGEVEQVTFGSRQLGAFSFSSDFRRMAYTVDTPTSPSEVHTRKTGFQPVDSGSTASRTTRGCWRRRSNRSRRSVCRCAGTPATATTTSSRRATRPPTRCSNRSRPGAPRCSGRRPTRRVRVTSTHCNRATPRRWPAWAWPRHGPSQPTPIDT